MTPTRAPRPAVVIGIVAALGCGAAGPLWAEVAVPAAPTAAAAASPPARDVPRPDPKVGELALPDGLAAGSIVLVESSSKPLRLELRPPGRALRGAWYGAIKGYLVAAVLPDAVPPRPVLAIDPGAEDRGAEGARLRLVATVSPEPLPLRAPVAGRAVAIALEARTETRALLLGGDLEHARLLLDGTELETRAGRAPRRALTLVPPGPATALLVVGPEGSIVSVRTASVHEGYPLPAPETFRLRAGESGTYAFELPPRTGGARIRFEPLDLTVEGQLRIEVRGEVVHRSAAGGVPGEPVEVVIAERLLARDQPTLVRFRLVGGGARGDAALPALRPGVRNVELDLPLPASGGFGPGPGGDLEHPSGILASYWPEGPRGHVLSFAARGLLRPAELEVWAEGRFLGTVGSEGNLPARDVEMAIPAAAVDPGRPNGLAIRPAAGAGDGWSVDALRVSPAALPEAVAAKAPPASEPRMDGPIPSDAPLGDPGQTPLSPVLDLAADPPSHPGQPAEPVGGTTKLELIPELDPVVGAPPGLPLPPGQDAHLVRGPVFTNSPLSAPASLDPQPGQPSLPRLWIGPPSIAPAAPEIPDRAPAAGRGTVLRVATEPPGASVFFSRSPSYRGDFLGLTPLEVSEDRKGLAYLRISHPGWHDAVLPLWLEGKGALSLRRPLLPFEGIDFGRPVDPRPRIVAETAGYAAPAPLDVDQDGRMDLVVGDEKGGLVWSRDTAALGAPRLDAPQELRRTDGRAIRVEGYASPACADWDGDGLPDLLVGDRTGQVHFFRRGPVARGLAFEDRGVLVADHAPLSVGNDAIPLVVDWNGDGLPDLLVGSGYGVVVLFVGIGSGELTQVGPVASGAEPLQSLLDVAPIDYDDWDGDGTRDLVLAGMAGRVLLFPGLADRAFRPEFGAPRPVTIRGGLDLYVGTYPHGFALDLDGDGYRDLFFGNAGGDLLWLRGGEPGEFNEIEPIEGEAAAPAAPAPVGEPRARP